METKQIFKFILFSIIIISCESAEKCVDNLNPDSIKTFDKVTVFDSKDSFKKGLLDGPMDISVREKNHVIHWNMYQSNDIQVSFSIPSNWNVITKEKAFLYCSVDDTDSSFFVVLLHDKQEINILLNTYKDLLVKDILSDTTEIFEIIESDFLQGISRNAHYLKMNSVINGNNKRYYSLLTENDNYIFDFSLCLSDDANDDSLSDAIFNLVLHSFRINECNLLNGT
jgi:hypothetical protein